MNETQTIRDLWQTIVDACPHDCVTPIQFFADALRDPEHVIRDEAIQIARMTGLTA